MVRNLEVPLRDEIDSLYKQAQTKLDNSDKDEAVKLAYEAWSKLPAPKYEWDVSKSFTHALAKILRDSGKLDEAVRVMEDLFASGTVKPYQDGPPFVLGTIYAAMGDETNARKWLREANRISKGRCFVGQPAKYRQYVE